MVLPVQRREESSSNIWRKTGGDPGNHHHYHRRSRKPFGATQEGPLFPEKEPHPSAVAVLSEAQVPKSAEETVVGREKMPMPFARMNPPHYRIAAVVAAVRQLVSREAPDRTFFIINPTSTAAAAAR